MTAKIAATAEQEAAVEAAVGTPLTKIVAFAGTGKTTTLRMAANRMSGLRGLYLAFNKAIKLDAEASFPKHVACRTAHGLAYAATTKLLRGKNIAAPSPHDLAELMGWSSTDRAGVMNGWIVRELLRTFCNSADPCPLPAHMPAHVISIIQRDAARRLNRPLRSEEVSEEVAGTAQAFANAAKHAWEAMIDCRHPLPITHDGYLKFWQLTAPRIGADFVLFDEAQDASPVMLSIELSQRSKIVLVGDQHQSIYSWRGAVDALKPEEGNSYPLTTSFRFGPGIEYAPNAILALKSETLRITGASAVDGEVLEPDTRREAMGARVAHITRTNAYALLIAIQNLATEQVCVVGGIEEMANLALSAYWLFRGLRQKVIAPSIRPYRDWEEFVDISETMGDREGLKLVELVQQYGDALPQMIDTLRTRLVTEAQATYTISTAHRAKGREFANVMLGEDFSIEFDRSGKLLTTNEEINVLYVACTRAKERLRANNALQQAMDPPPLV